MSTHSISRTLKTAFGLVLAASFAMISGDALARPDDRGTTGEDNIGEAELNLDPGVFRCTLAGTTITGSLLVRPDDTCRRFTTVLAGASNRYCPQGACVSCFSLARDLGCVLEN